MIKNLILFTLFAGTGIFAQNNLVENGDFKQKSKHWYVSKKDVGQFIFVPADKPDAPYLKITGADKPDGYARISNHLKLSADNSLKPGDSVTIKAKIKCEKLSGKFQIMLRQANAKGKSLNYTGITLRKRYKCNWKEFSAKAKILNNTARIYVYIISRYLSKQDTVYVKDITLEK